MTSAKKPGRSSCSVDTLTATLKSSKPWSRQIRLAQGHFQHPGADLDDDPQPLGGAHETLRHQHAQRRRLPAQQGFHAHDVAVAGADQRLVAQAQFAIVDGVHQLPGNDALAVRAERLVQHVHLHDISAFAAGLVQRVLGQVEQAARVGGVFRAQRHADLGGQEQGVGQHRQRQLHLLAQLLGHFLRQGHAAGARDGQHEFVAAMPPQPAAAAQVVAQALRDQHQRLVADLCAHVLVDRGEVVDVQVQQHQRRAAAGGVGDHGGQFRVAGAQPGRGGCFGDRLRGGVPHPQAPWQAAACGMR